METTFHFILFVEVGILRIFQPNHRYPFIMYILLLSKHAAAHNRPSLYLIATQFPLGGGTGLSFHFLPLQRSFLFQFEL